jgi:hypothetical protein
MHSALLSATALHARMEASGAGWALAAGEGAIVLAWARAEPAFKTSSIAVTHIRISCPREVLVSSWCRTSLHQEFFPVSC